MEWPQAIESESVRKNFSFKRRWRFLIQFLVKDPFFLGKFPPTDSLALISPRS